MKELLENISASQLDFFYYLQNFRTPLLDRFFIFLNFFDTTPFYFLLVCFVWVYFGRRWGCYLFFLLILSSSTNGLLKSLFSLPRPYHTDPSLAVLPIGGFSFPSGGAQSAVILPGLLILSFPKKWWSWVIGGLFFVLISFSRIYLGAHYPTDVFAGWIVGASLLFLYVSLFPKISKTVEKHPSIPLYFLIGFLLLLLFDPTPYLIRLFASSLGLYSASFFLQDETALSTNFFEKTLKFLICIGGLFLIFFLLRFSLGEAYALPLAYFLSAVWLLVLMDLLCKLFDKGMKKLR